MWTLTPLGFYSAVRKPGDAHLTIRARVTADLDALRDRYLPNLSPTLEGAGTDYPFRATCSPEDWATALAAMGRDIDYSNFKSEVAKRQGYERASVYGKVWSVLLKLENLSEPAVPSPALAGRDRPAPHPSGLAWSAGGVVIDDEGRVLLRHAARNFDGEGWTLAKGRPEPGESLEAAALREVREETGFRCEIVSAPLADLLGTTTVNRYWRMRPLEDTGKFNTETDEIAWCTPEEARHRIRTTTTSAVKVARDLRALELALADRDRQR